jgi:hypothetical protein
VTISAAFPGQIAASTLKGAADPGAAVWASG